MYEELLIDSMGMFMIQFNGLNTETFLATYWQRKPLLIKDAIPKFTNIIDPDELAGLSLEEDIESRIVIHTPGEAPFWHLKKGPFTKKVFTSLPASHWTLLVNGVDRVVPEIADLWEHFNFIPQWRFDDVMISFASKEGSVGPHYDNYDVFLYQAVGSRKWSLTSKNCIPENYLPDVPLRIMKEFRVEEEFILEEGDMLYLPPHIGHHGIGVSDACMTYSFGYRSYPVQELWESFGDFLARDSVATKLYKDSLIKVKQPGLITPDAWLAAKKMLQQRIEDEQYIKKWFGCYVTSLDEQAELQLPEELISKKDMNFDLFTKKLRQSKTLSRDGACRFAYVEDEFMLFINGAVWNTEGVDVLLIKNLCNQTTTDLNSVQTLLDTLENQRFLFELVTLGWIKLS